MENNQVEQKRNQQNKPEIGIFDLEGSIDEIHRQASIRNELPKQLAEIVLAIPRANIVVCNDSDFVQECLKTKPNFSPKNPELNSIYDKNSTRLANGKVAMTLPNYENPRETRIIVRESFANKPTNDNAVFLTLAEEYGHACRKIATISKLSELPAKSLIKDFLLKGNIDPEIRIRISGCSIDFFDAEGYFIGVLGQSFGYEEIRARTLAGLIIRNQYADINHFSIKQVSRVFITNNIQQIIIDELVMSLEGWSAAAKRCASMDPDSFLSSFYAGDSRKKLVDAFSEEENKVVGL